MKKYRQWALSLCMMFLVLFLTSVSVNAEEKFAYPDGSYQLGVTLEGGSGRATIQSPANVTIQNGEATVEIVWSSPNFDYMIVNGVKYDPVNTEGNSTFEIPVLTWENMEIIADTVAMSTPHEITYTLSVERPRVEGQGQNFAYGMLFGSLMGTLLLTLFLVKNKGNKR